MGSPDQREPAADPSSSWKSVAGGLVVVVGVAAVALWIFDRWIMPPTKPHFERPSAFDVLIDSRLIIGLIRLIAMILALYVIASVVAHIRGRRWIVTFGGATAGEGTDRTTLQKRLAEAEDKYKTLTGEYETVVELLARVLEETPEAVRGGGDDD